MFQVQAPNFKNPFEFELLRRLTDIILLGIAGHLASNFRFGAPLDLTLPIHAVLLYFCCALAFFAFPHFGLYASWRGRFMPFMFGRLILSCAMVLTIGLTFGFLIHGVGEVSRLWLFYWYLTSVSLLVLYRIVVYGALRFLRKKGINTKRVVIVGYGKTGQEMHKRAVQQDWYGYEVAAVYADEKDAAALNTSAVIHIDTLEGIHDYVVANHVNEIWITLPMSASAQLHELQYLLRNTLVDIRWIPDMLGLQMLSKRMVDFLGLPTVDLNRPVSHGMRGGVKHLLDKLFAIVALTGLAPLFAVIAVCIKASSPGPVFFRQARLGLNGKKFMVYKFRSMKVHQERDTVTQATQGDPRVTRIGQFLRSTSFDELPQFINVLLGDMSVVGPRPHALKHNEIYEELLELYMARHRVKPGITGWAQIHGLRGETDTVDKMEKRVEFDLHYIQHWSLLMDFRILVWTTFRGWTSTNAY
ncbi:undecaprenyl-phosphate glucose phosphotransferase [Collimonas antrihumi]|uniref:undecaprenyl-phosphate glucose phosphotransferase n=1 Tax=Collimonas antrihumi TaxID=1940615 RepID=UPI001B8B8FE7|nr:undecaprenyl-phosphate glucose phosphotransferase [Collimonas antrihumi]